MGMIVSESEAGRMKRVAVVLLQSMKWQLLFSFFIIETGMCYIAHQLCSLQMSYKPIRLYDACMIHYQRNGITYILLKYYSCVPHLYRRLTFRNSAVVLALLLLLAFSLAHELQFQYLSLNDISTNHSVCLNVSKIVKYHFL